MTWTAASDPRTRADVVRALVGDTQEGDPQIEDEDLAYFLAKEPTSDEKAAWRVCVFLIGKYARIAAAQVGPLKESSQERIENYSTLAQYYYDIAQGGSGNGAGGQALLRGAPQGSQAAVPSFFSRGWPR